jgi:hypothetical protein
MTISDVPPYAILSHTWGPMVMRSASKIYRTTPPSVKQATMKFDSAGSKPRRMDYDTSGSIPAAEAFIRSESGDTVMMFVDKRYAKH